MEIFQIQKVQAKTQDNLLKKANVVSVGYGYRVRNGEKTNELCLVVGVSQKVEAFSLGRYDLVPQTIDGVPVDVVEIGTVYAQPRHKKTSTKTTQEVDPTQKFRPAMPGVSISHKLVTAGTFSCVVKRNNQRLILSNNHVLANSGNAQIGDVILQPGTYDGGTTADQIGVLEDFVPIDFGNTTPPPDDPPTCMFARAYVAFGNFVARILGRKHRVATYKLKSQATPNLVDAALCRPLSDADIIDDIVQIGAPRGSADATLGMQVQKYGRTTHYTQSEILQLNVTVQVNYGPGQVATFLNQILTGPMSAGGDSGSSVLDMNNNVVGLLFAGSDTVTILNPIQNVFDALNVTL